jgi:uridine kinase
MKYTERTISSLSTSILAVERRPVLVGIDGQGGSGKSTLARELANSLSLDVAIVEGDDFYNNTPDDVKALLSPEEGYEEYFDWRRLKAEVLQSVRDQTPNLRYQRYDWDIAAMGEWIEIPMPEVIIVEGVYVLRPELREYFDVAAFVRTSEPMRLQRQVSRGQNSGVWISRWFAAEDFYVSREKPWEWVDVSLAGE